MAPKGANLVLTAHVPHGEADILVFDRLDVESYTTKEIVEGEYRSWE
jgi:hypothetical protein